MAAPLSVSKIASGPSLASLASLVVAVLEGQMNMLVCMREMWVLVVPMRYYSWVLQMTARVVEPVIVMEVE